MNAGPSGFHNAPVTRAFVIACAFLTIFLGVQRHPSFALGLSHQWQDIFKKLNIWRLVVSTFAFSSTAELMFGLYLLYYFRLFERQIGSNKYSIFILFSLVVSFLFEVLSLALLKDHLPSLLTSGPYGLIFSSFIPFLFDIPVSTRFCVLSIYFSDKSFIYLVGLQLLVSSSKRSLLPGFCGILAGFLYRLNMLGIRRMKFPDFVTSLFSWILWPVMGGSSSATSRRTAVESVHPYPGRQVGLQQNYPPSAPLTSVAEPPEDSIATLVSMGFDRNSARQALMQARNDISAATNILLETQSH